jgi:hypothetical protein
MFIATSINNLRILIEQSQFGDIPDVLKVCEREIMCHFFFFVIRVRKRF